MEEVISMNRVKPIDIAKWFINQNIEGTMGDLLKDFDVKRIRTGDILDGEVIDVNDKEVTVNINYAFDGVIEKNELTKEEITNTSNATYTNPVTGEKHNESFLELYYRSIDMTLDAIIKVNEYLYGNVSLLSLEKVFQDLSYDTGVSCSLGKKLIYVRKK